MGMVSTQAKFVGGGGALIRYYKEVADEGVSKALGYYGEARDGIVFSHVRGKAAAHLAGLDLSLGLTRAQFEQIHHGKWDGVQLVEGGKAPKQQTDVDGKPMWEMTTTADGTPKYKYDSNRLRIPVWEMEPKLTQGTRVIDPETGKAKYINRKPVLDPLTGEPLMKKVMEDQYVAGYDVTFAVDKSISELLIAHPEYTDTVRRCFLEAIDLAMTEVVEGSNKLVSKQIPGTDNKRRLEQAEGHLWWTVIGAAARPTPESEAWVADPHLAAHCFLSSLSYVGNGKWQKVDGRDLFRTAEHRAQVCSTQLNRLLEAEGIRIAYSETDLKGRIHSNIEGSNADARHLFSTNSQRAWRARLELERIVNGPVTEQQLRVYIAETKGRKSKAAKAADEMGNLDQIARWRKALEDNGIKLTIPKPRAAEKRDHTELRLDILHQRLEQRHGVARDIDAVAIFPSTAIKPAVHRCAEGLGFSIDELALIAGAYEATHLIKVTEAVGATTTAEAIPAMYTTHAILAAERDIADALEARASQPVPAVVMSDLMACIRSQAISLDHEQEALVKRICGTEAVVHGVGRAGSGKSAAMRPAVDALRRSGLVNEVVVLAVARKRAVETGEGVNADNSWSIEALRSALSNGWLPTAKTLIIVDEVSLVGSFDAQTIANALGPARFVTIGDQLQGSAIGSSGWLAPELKARPATELSHNYRQRNWQDREAWELLRSGDAEGCLDNLAKRNRIFATDDHQSMVRTVQERYIHYREKGYEPHKIGVINQGPNKVVDEVNRAIQRHRVDEHEIDEWEYFDVQEQSTPRRWRIHKGDEVVFNAPVYFKDPHTKPILNGTTATVLRMTPDGQCRVQLHKEDKRTITVQLTKEAQIQPIAPAYCLSTAKYQGGQVPVGIVIPGNEGIATLNSGYSEVTRGQDLTEIVMDRETWGEYPLQGLSRAWGRQAEQQMASTYMALLDQATINMHEPDLSEEIQVDGPLTPADEAKARIRDMRNGMDEGGMRY